ncbi:hypothetical protein BKA70DRAFT_718118 [Coprinopsis sp. MPI-PUGE-AT-0042]|nr:hypothetical protein BKA70DRAFT_718118 [Coprinopsis sp. MPI-PUGE-AT-0042]
MLSRYSTGLESIPVELLLEIQLFALSDGLPFVSRRLYQVFSATPPIYRAQYLSARLENVHDDSRLYTRALRYPMCTQAVLEAFHSAAIKRKAQLDSALLLEAEQEPGKDLANVSDPSSTEEKSTKRIPKPVTYDLPRRLFHNLVLPSTIRTWRETDPPLPFLRYLLNIDGIQPDINANNGYALTKAVHAQFLPLIQFLLDHGASPETKDGLAVVVAIRQRNLKLVKMLIERQGDSETSEGSIGSSREGRRGDLAKASESRSKEGFQVTGRGKRRRLEDRVKPNSKMLKAAVQCKAKDIVEYLCHEKGVVPDMQTLQLMM